MLVLCIFSQEHISDILSVVIKFNNRVITIKVESTELQYFWKVSLHTLEQTMQHGKA